MEEDIKILNDYLDENDKKFVKPKRLKFLQAIENLINKYKEQEAIITALKGANVVINQDLKEFKNSMAIISEICVYESKCHITSREAVEEIRKNIFWKAKGD